MLIPVFYVLNGTLLVSFLLAFRLASGERRFSLTLVQILLGLPLLAGEYLYLASCLELPAVQAVLFSEVVFALIWFSLALRLRRATVSTVPESRLSSLAEIVVGAVVAAAAGYFLIYGFVAEISAGRLVFQLYSPVYFSALFILMAVFTTAWRLEQFWRALDAARRWEYKFLVVGSYLVCGSLAWAASYRLTYLSVFPAHLHLLAVLLLFGWAMMAYAVTHHRLLNRKIFVSRKVVYSFVVPLLLAVYFLGFGILILAMRLFGLRLSFLLTWLLVAAGLVAVGLLAFSDKTRRRAQFFISTHFYINKYEYRDEWLALSQHLQGVTSEKDVVNALLQVLTESLYTSEIFMWLGDAASGYRLIAFPETFEPGKLSPDLAADDPLLRFIETHSYFHRQEKEPGQDWEKVMNASDSFLAALNLVLLAPIAIGNQLVGLIGLGPEYTGGRYGHDDFDLLTVLGSQTASALLAMRMAEKLALAREQQAWNRLSAFVLHDIKNAATMLSLLRENAPEHLHETEFQQDMLEVVDDALRRMGRVEERLRTLKTEITPECREVDVSRFLRDCRRRLEKKLSSLEIAIEAQDDIRLNTDQEFLFSILENLLLNAFEAGGEGTVVRIRVYRDDDDRQAVIELSDNGPGIPTEFLPDVLFEPFKTSKDGGSGIGLWQVKRMLESLGGSIAAENAEKGGGARFVVRLPLERECREIL